MTVESVLWEDYRRAVHAYWKDQNERNKRILDAQYIAFEMVFIAQPPAPGALLN
jgi:hypothetical protein